MNKQNKIGIDHLLSVHINAVILITQKQHVTSPVLSDYFAESTLEIEAFQKWVKEAPLATFQIEPLQKTLKSRIISQKLQIWICLQLI